MESLRCANCQSLQRRVHDLQAEIERFRRQLDEATRAGKRQTAPFAKGQPKLHPRKPGRKPGKEYALKAHRQPPSPEQIDDSISSRTAAYSGAFRPAPRGGSPGPAPVTYRANSRSMNRRLGNRLPAGSPRQSNTN
jgi:hypothetical protein